MIVPARDSHEIDLEICDLYLSGHNKQQIAVKVNLCEGTVRHRLGRLFRWGIITPRRYRWRRTNRRSSGWRY